MSNPPDDSVRLDKWLWAARFFKTRSAAADAVGRGQVLLNDVRPKPARNVRCGDRLAIERDGFRFRVTVLALAQKRASPALARSLYAEDADSVAEREAEAARQRAAAVSAPRFDGRPDKRGRRELRRLKTGD